MAIRMHDRDDKDDVLQEPVGVKVPVGDDPSAEETTHRASRGKGAHLGQFPAFEFLLDKKVLASGWLLLNWPLFCVTEISFPFSYFHFHLEANKIAKTDLLDKAFGNI